jgi:uncharacterized membrane protein
MVQFALVVTYMILTHLATVLGSDRLALVAVSLLVFLFLVEPLRRGCRWPYAVIAATLVVGVAAAEFPWARIVLFFPPVLVNLGLAWLFGHTLVRPRMPLVERIIRLLHERDDIEDPSVWDYARAVTLCWTALFCFNATVCAVLALVAVPGGLLATLGVSSAFTVPTVYWSLYSDAGCYVLTALLFLGEYQVRRRRFPWQPYRNFFDFMRRAIAIGPALMSDLGRRPRDR